MADKRFCFLADFLGENNWIGNESFPRDGNEVDIANQRSANAKVVAVLFRECGEWLN